MTPETIASLINLGAAGAVIIVVWIFLDYIKKRDIEWREFFKTINQSNADDIVKVANVLESIVNMFKDHDAITREAIATMKERTAVREPVSQPRPRPQK